MNCIEIQNNQVFDTRSVCFLNPDDFFDRVREELRSGGRMVALLPIDRDSTDRLIAVTAKNESSMLTIVGGDFESTRREFTSWADEFPQTNYFECELAEDHGYVPVGHPFLRPVRGQSILPGGKPYEFFRLDGDEVHEVAVGPIHAGVIEPGHFRFQCHGELVYNLEINLGYQHRGVEFLMRNAKPVQRIILAESIAGDTTVGHAFAHCSVIETLSQTQLGLRAESIRMTAAELERVAMHLAGLGGIANDVGFALPAASYGRLRTLAINSLASVCGSRFGKGLFAYGGTAFDITDQVAEVIRKNLETIQNDTRIINDYLFSSVGACARFEETGIVSDDLARSIGMVGLAARASGLEEDVRIYFPYGSYRYNPISMHTLNSGDVFARARLRALEMDETLQFLLNQLDCIPPGEIRNKTGEMTPYSGVVSMIEGWRGEIAHLAFTGKDGKLTNYKIKDPSFNNWYGLSLALRRTAISDFPLCNKSFDLSYCGHDL